MGLPEITDKLYGTVAYLRHEGARWIEGLAPGIQRPVEIEPFPPSRQGLHEGLKAILERHVRPGGTPEDAAWREERVEEFGEFGQAHDVLLMEARLRGLDRLFGKARRLREERRASGFPKPAPGERFACCDQAPEERAHSWDWRHVLTLADERPDILEDLLKRVP